MIWTIQDVLKEKAGSMVTVEMICVARDHKMGCDYVMNADYYQIKMVEKGSG